MIRREFLRLLAALITIVPISLTHAQGALEKQKISIAVGGKTLFYYLPLTIAERLGYFKDEGIDVEINDFPGGAYHAGCIYATTAFVKKNPNTTQAVVNAMVRAVRWLQKATPEQIVAAVPPEYYGDDKANYKAALQKNLAALSPDGLMTMEGAKNVYDVLNAFEPSVKAAKIELEKTFDNSFAQKALAKYR